MYLNLKNLNSNQSKVLVDISLVCVMIIKIRKKKVNMNYNINKSMGLQDISFDLGRVGSENFPSLSSFIEIFLNNENIDFSLNYCLFIKLIDKNGYFILLEEPYIFSLSNFDVDQFKGLYSDVINLIIDCQNKEFSEDFSGDFRTIQLCFGAKSEYDNVHDIARKVLQY